MPSIRISLPDDTVVALLKRSVDLYGYNDALALAYKRAISYKKMYYQVENCMALLKQLDIKHGDRVAILAPNMPQWVVAYLSILSIGAIAVPICPTATCLEVDEIISHAEPKMLIVAEHCLPMLKEIATARLGSVILLEEFSTLKGKRSFLPFSFSSTTVTSSDTAVLFYTSVGAGRTKAVELTHANLIASTFQLLQHYSLDREDAYVGIGSLADHFQNILGILLPMLNGSVIYLIEKQLRLSSLLETLQRVQPTVLLLHPNTVELIYNQFVVAPINENWLSAIGYRMPLTRGILHRRMGRRLMELMGGCVKIVVISGAMHHRRSERFVIESGLPYSFTYAKAEATALISATQLRRGGRGSLGSVFPNMLIRLDNIDPQTKIGEVVIKGPNVMKGYYREAVGTAQVLSCDGWLHTGDLALIDRKHQIYHRGSSKQMILSYHGDTVLAEDVEFVVNQFWSVADSLVANYDGETVVYIKPVDDYALRSVSEVEALKEFVHQRVHKSFQIRRIELVDYLEKSRLQRFKSYLYNSSQRILPASLAQKIEPEMLKMPPEEVMGRSK